MSLVYSRGSMEEYGHPSILILRVGFLAAGLWESWKGRSIGSIHFRFALIYFEVGDIQFLLWIPGVSWKSS